MSEEWEKIPMGSGDKIYVLVKKHSTGLFVQKKYYLDGKLDCYDWSKKEDKKSLGRDVYYFTDLLMRLSEDSDGSLANTIEMIFWKVFNSLDSDHELLTKFISNFSYLRYHERRFLEGVAFATFSAKIKKYSSTYDTIGEGYVGLKEYDNALIAFDMAVNLDEENKELDEDHICNLIKVAIETKNTISFERGLDLLKA